MSKYDKERVPASSLQVGDIFQPPLSEDAICKVVSRVDEEDDGKKWLYISFDLVEGLLRYKYLTLNPMTAITLLHPKTTFHDLGGKAWLNKIKESMNG